ncbi:hypothetical protein COOONC_13182, partial [Cooperia oncophora]
MLEHMTREESELVGDYEVSYLGYIYDPKGKAARQAQDYSILAHDPIYKGAVVLGRLFNHSQKHANLKPLQPTRSFLDRPGEQSEHIVLFKATRNIEVSTVLLYPHYNTLESSEKLAVDVDVPPRMGAMPPDDDSYSQQMAISPEEELFDVRRIVTAHNVLCSLNVKTRVPGLIGSSRLADVGDAYRHSRLMFLGEEDGYPLSEDDGNIPLNANALLQLLCVAHRDAYGKGNPVVLLLKHEEGGARMRRRSVGAVLVVVLLGNLIEAVEKKRYGNCIVYDDVTKDYEVV